MPFGHGIAGSFYFHVLDFTDYLEQIDPTFSRAMAELRTLGTAYRQVKPGHRDIIFTLSGIYEPTEDKIDEQAWAALIQGDTAILNGGFETAGGGGVDIWASWTESAGDGALANETSLQRTGNDACKATAGSTANTYTKQAVTVIPGKKYKVTFWTRGDGTYGGRYKVYDATGAADILDLRATGITGTSYALVTGMFTAPSGCISAELYLYCPSTDTGVVYFDDVVFAEAGAARVFAYLPQADSFEGIAYCGVASVGTDQMTAGDGAVSMPVGIVAAKQAGRCVILQPLSDETEGGNSSGHDSDLIALANGGFETAGGGNGDIWGSWTENAGDGALANETGITKAGDDACKATAGASVDTYVKQAFGVVPGRRYSVSFWTRGDATYAGRYKIRDATAGADIVAVVTTGVEGATYTEVTREFTAPAGCASVEVYLYCPGTNGGIAYFDVVAITPREDAEGYLICTAIGAGATLTVTIQDSPNGSDWSTLIAFTALTDEDSEAKTFEGSVERHDRVLWTLAGGEATATFFVALGRR